MAAGSLSQLGRAVVFAWSHGDAKKANCVLEHLCEDRGFREISRRHAVEHETVRRWVGEFRRLCADLCRIESLEPRELVQPEGPHHDPANSAPPARTPVLAG